MEEQKRQLSCVVECVVLSKLVAVVAGCVTFLRLPPQSRHLFVVVATQWKQEEEEEQQEQMNSNLEKVVVGSFSWLVLVWRRVAFSSVPLVSLALVI